jgi:hypothetical protein
MAVSVKGQTLPGSSQGEVGNGHAFAALRSDGTVVCWGDTRYGGGSPSGLNRVTQIFSSRYGFAALKSDGTVVSWGGSDSNGTALVPPAELSGVTQIFSTYSAFAALKSDGTVVCWGDSLNGGTTPSSLGNVREIVSNYSAFAALKKTALSFAGEIALRVAQRRVG